MKHLQVINVRRWHARGNLRDPGLGGSRLKVVMQKSPAARAEYMVKTYGRSIGELRAEVIASNLG